MIVKDLIKLLYNANPHAEVLINIDYASDMITTKDKNHVTSEIVDVEYSFKVNNDGDFAELFLDDELVIINNMRR